MIWAIPVESVGQVPVESAVMDRTLFLYCVGEGKQPLFLFGVVPTNLALRSGFIWLHLLQEPTIAQLRLLKKAWPVYANWLGWNLLGFCPTKDLTARRFMEFFDMELTQQNQDYTLYRGH